MHMQTYSQWAPTHYDGRGLRVAATSFLKTIAAGCKTTWSATSPKGNGGHHGQGHWD